jgi:hypothetical protein
MNSPKIILVVTLSFLVICAQALCGCVVFPALIVPGVAHYDESVAQTDLPQLAHHPDVIALASQVGKSLGYQVSLQNHDVVILVYETPFLKEPVTGKCQSIRIVVYKVTGGNLLGLSLAPDDKELQKLYAQIKPPPFKGETVHLAVYGDGVNLGAGSQAEINEIMETFKNKLLARASAAPSRATRKATARTSNG